MACGGREGDLPRRLPPPEDGGATTWPETPPWDSRGVDDWVPRLPPTAGAAPRGAEGAAFEAPTVVFGAGAGLFDDGAGASAAFLFSARPWRRRSCGVKTRRSPAISADNDEVVRSGTIQKGKGKIKWRQDLQELLRPAWPSPCPQQANRPPPNQHPRPESRDPLPPGRSQHRPG
jgi:hypothetical protein